MILQVLIEIGVNVKYLVKKIHHLGGNKCLAYGENFAFAGVNNFRLHLLTSFLRRKHIYIKVL